MTLLRFCSQSAPSEWSTPPPFFPLRRVHISSVCLPAPFWVFLTQRENLLLTDLTSLVCHRSLRILLSLFSPQSPCRGYRGKAPNLAPAWVLRIWIQILIPVQEVLYPLIYHTFMAFNNICLYKIGFLPLAFYLLFQMLANESSKTPKHYRLLAILLVTSRT